MPSVGVANRLALLLASLRNVNKMGDPKEPTEYEERQVFCELLALQHISNYHELMHWVLIQTTTFYGRGGKNIATYSSSFGGARMGKSFQYREFKKL